MKSNILHRQTAHDYPLAVRGEGPYLFDQDGKQYLDASGGAAVSCLGHGHADIQQAIVNQVNKLAFAHTGFFSNEPAERLAETLIEKSPAGDGRVMFVSGGSEAIEAAIKLCRQIHVERGDAERTHYIARRQSYHGTTMGALALGHHVARRKPYEPLLQNGPSLSNVSHIAPCNAYRFQGSLSEEDYSELAAKDLEDQILRIGPEKVAAFFAETVSGSSLGAMPPTRGYFARIREICDRYGVLLVLDEVMCGMGRTGYLFACEKDDIIPDMVTLAKGLGGGYQPIGAVVLKPGLAETIDQGSGALMQSHTYMAHATACACGLAVLNTIE
ncbi:MAG: aminotransferase class III-fold pyridoxal phosphate-dependent enzyme, partial [Methyloligellaceae bacterium]